MQRKLCFFLTSACLLSTGRIRRGRVSPDRLSERCCLSQALARRCECSLSIPGLESKAHHPRVALAIWEQRGHSQSPSLLALRLSQTPALCCYPADGCCLWGRAVLLPGRVSPSTQHPAAPLGVGSRLLAAGEQLLKGYGEVCFPQTVPYKGCSGWTQSPLGSSCTRWERALAGWVPLPWRGVQ